MSDGVNVADVLGLDLDGLHEGVVLGNLVVSFLQHDTVTAFNLLGTIEDATLVEGALIDVVVLVLT